MNTMPRSTGAANGSRACKAATAAGLPSMSTISNITSTIFRSRITARCSIRQPRTSQPAASQTAWALLGLMAAGEVGHPAVAPGVEYLIATQNQKGLWDEQRYTATGFPRVFYLRYHGYPKFFPLWALARYRNLRNTNSRVVGVGM